MEQCEKKKKKREDGQKEIVVRVRWTFYTLVHYVC